MPEGEVVQWMIGGKNNKKLGACFRFAFAFREVQNIFPLCEQFVLIDDSRIVIGLYRRRGPQEEKIK